LKNIKHLIFILFFLSLLSCKTVQYGDFLDTKRVISNKKSKEEFFVTYDKPQSLQDVEYYWYKSREIHTSFKDYSGELLDGIYTRYYRLNELAEKGNFKKGLKYGEWKTWHKDTGFVKLSVKWKKGKQQGREVAYDSLGKLNYEGYYKNGLKNGIWVLHKSKDTLYYNKDKKISKAAFLASKGNVLNKLFERKEKGNIDKKEKINFLNKLFFKNKNKAKKKSKIKSSQSKKK